MKVLLFHVILIHTIVFSDSYQTTIKHTNSPGIYYEELNNLKLFNDKWTLMIVVNLNTFEIRREMLYEITKKINMNCLNFNLNCTEINTRISEFDTKLFTIERTLEYETRKAINNTNSISELDFEYTHKLKDLETLKFITMRENKECILYSQLGLINIILNNTYQQLNKTFLEFQDITKTNITREKKISEYKTNTMFLFNLMDQILSYHSELSNEVFEVTRDARYNLIHSSLFENEGLNDLMEHINRLAYPNEFPLQGSDPPLKELSKLCKINVNHLYNRLIFEIEIPLVHSREFVIYRVNSLPSLQQLDNKFFTLFIKPSSKYFIISKDGKYFNMSEKQLELCKVTRKKLLCEQTNEINTKDNSLLCEYQLLKENHESSFHFCNVQYKQNFVSEWNRIGENPEWIFSLIKPENLTISCKNEPNYKISLKKTGIMKLGSNCQLKHNNYYINSHSYRQNIKSVFVPKLDLKIQNLISEKVLSHLSLELIINRRNYSEELSLWELETRILTEISNMERIMIYTHLSAAAILIVLIVSLVMLSLATIFYKYRKAKLEALRNESTQTIPFYRTYFNAQRRVAPSEIFSTMHSANNTLSTDAIYSVPATYAVPIDNITQESHI